MNRGIRNNNPLNIRRSADHWQGMRDEQTDPSFVQFKTKPVEEIPHELEDLLIWDEYWNW